MNLFFILVGNLSSLRAPLASPQFRSQCDGFSGFFFTINQQGLRALHIGGCVAHDARIVAGVWRRQMFNYENWIVLIHLSDGYSLTRINENAIFQPFDVQRCVAFYHGASYRSTISDVQRERRRVEGIYFGRNWKTESFLYSNKNLLFFVRATKRRWKIFSVHWKKA